MNGYEPSATSPVLHKTNPTARIEVGTIALDQDAAR